MIDISYCNKNNYTLFLFKNNENNIYYNKDNNKQN